MRCLKKICSSLLILSVIFMMAGQTALAAEEEYTYTVRLYAGNQGTLTGSGIEVSGSGRISSGQDEIVISGLRYGDTVYITPQEAAGVTDDKYYVRGVRRSGRDNSEATESSFQVASDRDYVIAYGIAGDMVSYTVNYLDEDGNALLPADTYYGVIGERQYVSARYVDGYQPQALNLVKTLSGNEAENIFEFRYSQAAAGTGTTGETTTEGGTTVTVIETGTGAGGAAADAGAAGAGAAGAGAAGAGAGGAGAAGAGAGGAAGAGDAGAADADAGAGAADAVGGDFQEVPDGEVPQAEPLRDLDDEEVPLANIGGDQTGTALGYLPFYAGIGAAAVSALLLTAVYLRRKRKASAVRVSDESDDDRNQP